MVLGPDHTPLSKRHGATSVAEFRDRGYLPEALVNYLSLIGWSPGNDEELMPSDELAKRFSIEAVGHSAGVFDEEKLAWVNRHYLKRADPERIARLAMRHFVVRGWVRDDSLTALDYLVAIMPLATGSVDRIDQIPDRCRLIFEYDAAAALARPQTLEEAQAPAARAVVAALADELANAPRLLDRETFRAVANRVNDRTGEKGRNLFHPIRIALTGEGDGPELDLLIPAIDRGVEMGIERVIGCRERAAAFSRALDDARG
jgi:glutamyl-tRNA synthetase/nondiscriminating glutamyl-tRNA synthetase